MKSLIQVLDHMLQVGSGQKVVLLKLLIQSWQEWAISEQLTDDQARFNSPLLQLDMEYGQEQLNSVQGRCPGAEFPSCQLSTQFYFSRVLDVLGAEIHDQEVDVNDTAGDCDELFQQRNKRWSYQLTVQPGNILLLEWHRSHDDSWYLSNYQLMIQGLTYLSYHYLPQAEAKSPAHHIYHPVIQYDSEGNAQWLTRSQEFRPPQGWHRLRMYQPWLPQNPVAGDWLIQADT